MIANLYLHPDTFKYNGSDTRQQVEGKLKKLVSDMADVLNGHHAENNFKVPSSLALTPLYQNEGIYEVASACLSPDESGVFYPIMANTKDDFDHITYDQLKQMCKYEASEEEVNSMLVLNQVEDYLSEKEREMVKEEEEKNRKTVVNDYITFDEYKVVYDKQSWMYLRRQILGNHPGKPDEFVGECITYFPNICFHPNCVDSLKDDDYNYLDFIPRKLVYYLSCLNDKFSDFHNEYAQKGAEPNTILADFSGRYNFDQAGSLQQNPAKKSSLTFGFKDKNNQTCSALCEPHLKITQPDKGCKGKNVNYDTFHPRIYFSFNSLTTTDLRIPVGSMGKHI